eukprot:3939282-Alexandrium_andersonii.AAC.1
MSASLVGSEMCIRDSPAGWSLQRPDVLARSSISDCGSAWELNRPPTSPVSYTHLTLPTICSV